MAAARARPRQGASRSPGRRPRRARTRRLARRISAGRSGGRSSRGSASAEIAAPDFRPSREDILRYISENPGASGKRELARAFNLKGGDRIWLKDMLRQLADEGLIEKRGKRLGRPGFLPHVGVLGLFSRDAGGAMLALPAHQLS